MKKESKKFPKKGDILVLKNNRDVIYEFNPNNPKGNPNACNVAVHFYDNIGEEPVVNYKLSDLDCVGYDAPWDYATDDEIQRFYEAIDANDKKVRKQKFINLVQTMYDDYYKELYTFDEMKDELVDIINKL